MKKVVIGILVVAFLIIFIAISFYLVSKPRSSGLYIQTDIPAKVIINSDEVGMTPFHNKSLDPGEYGIKLVPLQRDTPPFETKVFLSKGIETVLRREFGKSEDISSTELITFEKILDNQVVVSIVTVPPNSSLLIDGALSFSAPYTTTLSEGKHTLRVSSPGYVSKEVNFKAYKGYKLVAYVTLKKDKGGQFDTTPTPTPTKVFVEILDTPTGFLRVRKDPTSSSEIVGQIKPGGKFELLEEKIELGWYKIEFEPSRTGWISSEFAKKVQDSLRESSIAPTSTPKQNQIN